MRKNPKELLLIITAMSGYLEYGDASSLFKSISNRNRVIKECKNANYIAISSSKGLRTIHLRSDGKKYVREHYPEVSVYEYYTGDLDAKKRRCVIGKALCHMALMEIPVGEQNEGCYFKLKMDGAGTDRGYRTGRMVGIYSTPYTDYMTYQLAEAGIRWNDRREASQAALIHAKRKKEVGMLVLAKGMSALAEILENTDLTEAEKMYRRSKGTLRVHLGDNNMPFYYIPVTDVQTATLELKILGDMEIRNLLESTFGQEGENVLIPINVRKLYGLYKEPHPKVVYVLESHEEYVRGLLERHQVIGIPVDGLRDAITKEE